VSSTISTDVTDQAEENFDGVWILGSTTRPLPWLRKLVIYGDHVVLGDGSTCKLKRIEGGCTSLQGGTIFIEGDLLHRRGKSGKICTFFRGTPESPYSTECYEQSFTPDQPSPYTDENHERGLLRDASMLHVSNIFNDRALIAPERHVPEFQDRRIMEVDAGTDQLPSADTGPNTEIAQVKIEELASTAVQLDDAMEIFIEIN